MQKISYSRHRFPGSIIQHAVWLYFRFPLSFRDVEDMLAERGIDVSYESVRRRSVKFGLAYGTRRISRSAIRCLRSVRGGNAHPERWIACGNRYPTAPARHLTCQRRSDTACGIATVNLTDHPAALKNVQARAAPDRQRAALGLHAQRYSIKIINFSRRERN